MDGFGVGGGLAASGNWTVDSGHGIRASVELVMPGQHLVGSSQAANRSRTKLAQVVATAKLE